MCNVHYPCGKLMLYQTDDALSYTEQYLTQPLASTFLNEFFNI